MTRNGAFGWYVLACLGGVACGSPNGNRTDGAATSGSTTANQSGAGSSSEGAASMQTSSTSPSTNASGSASGSMPTSREPERGESASGAAAASGSAGVPEVAGTSSMGLDAGAVDPAAADANSTGAFPPVTDFSQDGPFAAVTLDNTGPNQNYTVYYPKQLAPDGAKNPIVGWMSGGGTDPSLYPLLPLLATHGFVVVASNTVPGIGEEASLGKEIIAGIDWAIAENDRKGSAFYQKLDTTKLASTGYSMGSLATFQIAGDPRLTTTVHISGGNMAPEPIHNLHAPAAFFCGIPGDDSCNILSDTCDIAAANCDQDFAAATTPVFYANFSGGHLGILTPPLQGQIQTEVVAWLRWQLMGDATIKSRFVGDQCGVCEDSRWKVQQKNLH